VPAQRRVKAVLGDEVEEPGRFPDHLIEFKHRGRLVVSEWQVVWVPDPREPGGQSDRGTASPRGKSEDQARHLLHPLTTI
jgi:hypothetical protein